MHIGKPGPALSGHEYEYVHECEDVHVHEEEYERA
jgi:hypothetical protein